MKVSIVITVLNEEKTIIPLLGSIIAQTKKPDEIIIVDGGSTDLTVSNIKYKISNIKKKKVKVFMKKGNRSVGRNFGIKNAKNEIIAITDAGCIADKYWLENIAKPLENPEIDVVAGFYRGMPQTIFEKCLIPYILVMPDRVNAENFLPAGRSMAIRKTLWEKMDGFPEQYSYNEDHVFAKKLKKEKVKIIFAKNAVVGWMPRKSLKEAYLTFFNFARGDAQAGIFRPKAVLIFIRYFIFLASSYLIVNTIYLILALYIFWAIFKNYKYVRHWQAILFLPILQFTSDIAVISGTIRGLFDDKH